MRRYLILWSPGSGQEVSSSRDAMKHLIQKNAQTVWVYDSKGWWISFADRDANGKRYRPLMCPDGEPRKYYAELYHALISKARLQEGQSCKV